MADKEIPLGMEFMRWQNNPAIFEGAGKALLGLGLDKIGVIDFLDKLGVSKNKIGQWDYNKSLPGSAPPPATPSATSPSSIGISPYPNQSQQGEVVAPVAPVVPAAPGQNNNLNPSQQYHPDIDNAFSKSPISDASKTENQFEDIDDLKKSLILSMFA